jgi:hypothetical protein
MPGWNAAGFSGLKVLNQAPWADRFPPRERVGKGIVLWYFAPPPGVPVANPPVR